MAGPDARMAAPMRPPGQFGGMAYLVANQVLSRGLTFALNALVVRSVDPSAYGVASVRLNLVLVTAGTLVRDTLRQAAARLADERQLALNLAWLSPTLVALLVAGILFVERAMGEASARDGYRLALAVFCASSVLEAAAEPAYVSVQARMLWGSRAFVEGSAHLARCLATYCALVGGAAAGARALRAFALGQLCYAAVYAAGFWAGALWRGEPLAPRRAAAAPHRARAGAARELVCAYVLQQLAKFALTHGESIVLLLASGGGGDDAGASSCAAAVVACAAAPAPRARVTDAQHGAFALVSNLGSLLARFVLEPAEETAFAQLASHARAAGEHALRASHAEREPGEGPCAKPASHAERELGESPCAKPASHAERELGEGPCAKPASHAERELGESPCAKPASHAERELGESPCAKPASHAKRELGESPCAKPASHAERELGEGPCAKPASHAERELGEGPCAKPASHAERELGESPCAKPASHAERELGEGPCAKPASHAERELGESPCAKPASHAERELGESPCAKPASHAERELGESPCAKPASHAERGAAKRRATAAHARGDAALVHGGPPERDHDEQRCAAAATVAPSAAEERALALARAGELLARVARRLLLLALVFATFGPAYARLLLQLAYGARWAAGDAPPLLASYCLHTPMMALNGILEAAVRALATPAQLRDFNGFLAACALGYWLGMLALLRAGCGLHGVIFANALNLAARAAHHLVLLGALFAPRDGARRAAESWARRLLPTRAQVAMLAAAAVAVHASAARAHARAPAGRPVPARAATEHVALGALNAAAVAYVLVRAEFAGTDGMAGLRRARAAAAVPLAEAPADGVVQGESRARPAAAAAAGGVVRSKQE
ncbi:hypothetical protein KFE25_005587 [Diacronema lutheri]|uniref:Man(5)GlcNAc(2)-PP-dolichol translocation protein RFT1 n=1 Tax=Diacronema lutheri TaxID=2081491 RepID=A0A8J5XKB3_DIALT|nr:hypothetical protein KFE25_005587 [Diacronema lutheri]